MKILQSGVAKSGNYWLYRIIQSILRRSGAELSTYIETDPIYPIARAWPLSYPEQASIDTIDITDTQVWYRISSIYRWPVDDIDAYLAHTTHVWTHSQVTPLSRTLFPKFDKIVYIIRDPRDVIQSMSRFAFTPYMQQFYPTEHATPEAYLDAWLDKHISAWRRHVAGHVMAAAAFDIIILFYERLLDDLPGQLEALCHGLGIEPTPDLIAGVQADVQFESMQASSPGHVRQGTARQWVTGLTYQQQQRVLRQAGGLMALLGYPMSATDTRLPALPTPIPVDLVAKVGQPPAPPRVLHRMLRSAARRMRR
ncbi:MAG: sulfotransferase domain-containing protein [Chloroflexi bacterium]|nr:sulfotransferase domain-containing protein [Chloroflexota bacterium]